MISLDYHGDARIERGLVRKSDARASKREAKLENPSALPAPLVADLTAQKSAALGAELMQRPTSLS